MQPSFFDFRDGVGGEMTHRLLRLDISNLTDWRAFMSAALAHQRRVGVDKFFQRIRETYDVASTGERTVIVAILYAIDYIDLADEFAAGRFFGRLAHTYDRHMIATLAALAARDPSLI